MSALSKWDLPAGDLPGWSTIGGLVHNMVGCHDSAEALIEATRNRRDGLQGMRIVGIISSANLVE